MGGSIEKESRAREDPPDDFLLRIRLPTQAAYTELGGRACFMLVMRASMVSAWLRARGAARDLRSVAKQGL